MKAALFLLALSGASMCKPAPRPSDAVDLGSCRNPCGYFDDGGFGKCPAALPGYTCVEGCCVPPDMAGACATCAKDSDCAFERCGKTGGICAGGTCSFAPGCPAACNPRDPKACSGAGPSFCYCGDLTVCCCISWN